MRQLLVTNDFPPMPGGEARWYARLCASVRPDDVRVLAPRYDGDCEADGSLPYRVTRLRLPISPHPAARLVQLLGLAAAAVREVRRDRIIRLHIAHLYLGPVGLLVRALTGVPYVLYLHGGEMAGYMRSRPVRALVRRIVRIAEAVVVNSEFTRAHFLRLGAANPHTVRLPMSVAIPPHGAGEDGGALRRRYGLDGERIILTVGRLVERKGHDSVIRVLPRVRERVGPVRYVIAGSGPEEQRLRRLAAETGVARDVIFAGHVADDELARLYAACEVFAMPSRALPGRDGVEGFGIVFLEAAAAGRPAVGGRSGGIAEAVADGETGLLVEPDDADALAAAIIRLLEDRALAARLGERGRERVLALEREWRAGVAAVWGS